MLGQASTPDQLPITPLLATDCPAWASGVFTALGTLMSTGFPTGAGSLPQAKGLQESKRGARNQEARRLLNQQPRDQVQA